MIDLSSDTATRPTDAMRAAIAAAPVGDDQRGEDPTVNALQDWACQWMAKEAAIFLPCASMANQIALRIHTRPGDEVVCADASHIHRYESGAPAVLSSLLLKPLPAPRGILTPEQIHSAVNPPMPHCPPTTLVSLENTHNVAGGTVWQLDETSAVAAAAREHGMGVHLDGARFVNAMTALGTDAATLAAPFDTVTLCLSKGIGAPAGALLLGTRTLVAAARRWKHCFGGAMRQAGILAAGGLHGLQHHLPDIAVDHANAQRLAQGLSEIPGIRLDPWPETNIVYFNVAGTGLTGTDAMARLEANGVRASGMGATRLRFVTHRDISPDQIEIAVEACKRALTI
jgi:threonine aldolase